MRRKAMTETTTPQVDLAKVQQEINSLSNAQVREQLLTVKVRQKKQQKKMQGSSSQKAYQARQKAARKLLKERAIALGIYDEINEEANKRAEEELAGEAVDQEEVEA
jgi:hypothetical protein